MNTNHTLPAVCIVIVSYNFEPWIDRCLPSVLASHIPVTVVVVDNNSSDRTRDIIRSRYPEVVLIESEENLGFGRANNLGFQYAMENEYQYLFLMNQDARIEPDTVSLLVEASKSDSSYGILSPIHLNSKGNATDFGFAEYTGIQNREDATQLSEELREYPFINAAFWLIPVHIIREVGGFAPLFSHYGEDRNLVQRIQKKGYKLGLVRAAVGYHERENRIVSREQFFYSEHVYFLTEAANPFYNDFKAFTYSVAAAIKKALKAIIKGNMRDATAYLGIAKRLAGELREAKTTRRMGTPMQK